MPSVEVHRLETEVSQMKSELHNAKEEIQMAQSLLLEKDNAAEKMRAKFAEIEAEKLNVIQRFETKKEEVCEVERLLNRAEEQQMEKGSRESLEVAFKKFQDGAAERRQQLNMQHEKKSKK